jgi:hypothetical protein
VKHPLPPELARIAERLDRDRLARVTLNGQ